VISFVAEEKYEAIGGSVREKELELENTQLKKDLKRLKRCFLDMQSEELSLL
jgi:hypothetical protein